MSIQTPTAKTGALVALDIDGTLLDAHGRATVAVRDTVGRARAAGHHLVLATGRSLAGLLPVATTLGLTDGWAVASNGALLVRLDPAAPGGYHVEDSHLFDPRRVIRRAQELRRGVVIAVEEVGVGWCVSRRLPVGALNGVQHVTSVAELCTTPAPRIALIGPEIRRYVDALTALGVTVTPAGSDWLDVVGTGVTKATTLEKVRLRLGVPRGATVAVGDGLNDLAMFAWAEHSFAMANAPAIVRHAATKTCGSLADDGAAEALQSLLPATAAAPGHVPSSDAIEAVARS